MSLNLELTEKFNTLLMQSTVLEKHLKKKLKVQKQIPSYADKKIMETITKIKKCKTLDNYLKAEKGDKSNLNLAHTFFTQSQTKRFQYHAKRILEGSSDIPPTISSQGTISTLSWKGLPLIKTKEDFAIITQLIQELRPKTIIEIGSGCGASAIWMADLLLINQVKGKVYSIDQQKVDTSYDTVEFIQGDAIRLKELLPRAKVTLLPHPWLIIDDAHQTIVSVLEYLNPMMQRGDYVYVEDSKKQQNSIGAFIMNDQNSFMTDTFYTDFFGRNSVSAKNSILKKVK